MSPERHRFRICVVISSDEREQSDDSLFRPAGSSFNLDNMSASAFDRFDKLSVSDSFCVGVFCSGAGAFFCARDSLRAMGGDESMSLGSERT